MTRPDGTPYTLIGPNPAMAGQAWWDDGILYHNLDFPVVTYTPTGRRLKEVARPESPPVVVATPSVPGRVLLETTDHVTCQVLPTEIKTTVDPVYGEEVRRLAYGTRFTLDVIPREQNDLFATFWTNGVTALERGSILFANLRYWKVQEAKPGDGGLVIRCVVSDQTPSFG